MVEHCSCCTPAFSSQHPHQLFATTCNSISGDSGTVLTFMSTRTLVYPIPVIKNEIFVVVVVVILKLGFFMCPWLSHNLLYRLDWP